MQEFQRIPFKRIFPLVFISLLGVSIESNAQSVSSGEVYYSKVQVFKLKAWTIMNKREWNNVIYSFPEFQEASIALQGGFSPSRKLRLNFNIYLERIEIITESGDTIDFKNSAEIKSIKTADHLFYNDYPNGYVEILNQTSISLGAKHALKMVMENSSGQTFVATDWKLPTSIYDRIYIKEDSYFFLDSNSQLHKATLPSLLNLFPNSRSHIKRFVRKNKIDFKVKSDLLKLLNFCNQMEQPENP